MSPRHALNQLIKSKEPQRVESVLSTRQDHIDSVKTIIAEIRAVPTSNFDKDINPQNDVRTQPYRLPSDSRRWFVMTDICGLVLGFALAWAAAYAINNFILDRPFNSLSILMEHIRFVEFSFVSTGLILWLAHLGHYKTRMPFWFETKSIVQAIAGAMVMDGFIQFASKQDFSRLWLTFAWLSAGVSIIALRHLSRLFMQKRGTWQIRTLLVGSGTIADETRAALYSEPELGYQIVMQIENLPLLLRQANNSWKRLCDRFNADYVVIAMDSRALTDASDEIAQLTREGIPFSVSPPLRNMPVLGMTPQYFFNHDVMLMTHRSSLEEPMPRFMKRSLDIIGAAGGLLLLSPVLLTLAFLVKRDGGGIFYGDKRMGMKGKAFFCLKFRSMIVDSGEVLKKHLEENPLHRTEWQKFHKLRYDPRVTRVGTFMRKWSLDELPQLINVLRGDMSLVGPRPVNSSEMDEYKKESSMYNKVRPGLTGLWQVSGRNNISFERRVQMDSWYVRNWSLWHDIVILCKTIPAVFRKTGAS